MGVNGSVSECGFDGGDKRVLFLSLCVRVGPLVLLDSDTGRLVRSNCTFLWRN